MSDIIKPEGSDIVSLIKKGGELGKAFGQEVYLLEVLLAGTTHIDNIKELEPSIMLGDKVSFFREPFNKFDNKAIVAKDEKGNKLGYVPKKQNEILSRLLDAGKLIYAIVDNKEYKGEWLKITLKVYLSD